MAILTILEYPDQRLHTVAEPVNEITDATRKLISDMADTMYAAPGIGLAATQVNVHQRVIVIDISEMHDQLQVLINPEIIVAEGQLEGEEGCLSVPGVYDKVRRAERITVRALNEHGVSFTLETEGLLAVCVQHEIDHINGKVFVQHLSQLKQVRLKKKISKHLREAT